MIQLSEDLRKITGDSVRGTFILSMGSIISTIISAFSVFIIANLLGPELYGIYTISLTIPLLLLLFVDFGINQALTHFSASLQAKDEEGKLAKILRHGILFKTLISIILFSIALIFSDYFAMYLINRPDYGIYIRLCSFLIILQSIFKTIRSIFVGLDHTEYHVIATTIQALIKAIISSLLVIIGLGVIGVITGFVMSYVIAALISVVLFFFKIYKPLNSGKDKGYSTNSLKIILSYGFPLYLSSLLLGLSSQLQNLILSNFASDIIIGNFKASMNFISIPSIITNAVVLSLLPAFSKLKKSSDQTTTLFTLANKYTCLFIVPITILLIIFSNELVQVIYSSSYQSAPLLLSLSVLPFFLVGLGYFTLSGFFNGLGETKAIFKMYLLYFIVFVFLAPILTKTYNVPGLIIAIFLSTLAFTILGGYIAKKRFQVQLDYNTTVRIYSVAFISALPALLIDHLFFISPLVTLLLSGLVYFFTYITLLPIARIIDEPELESIIQVINNIGFLKSLVNPFLVYILKLTRKIER